MSVLVFIDTRGEKVAKAVLEALTYGRKVAEASGTTLTAVTFGDSGGDKLAALNANKVIVARAVGSADGQQLTKLVVSVAQSEDARIIVFVQDNLGKAVAPRVAARLKAGQVAGAISLPDMANGFRVRRNVFSGKAQAWVEVLSPIKVISMMPNSLPIESGTGGAVVEEFNGDLGAARIIVKELRVAGAGIPLPEAEIVVSAGRGMKGPENWAPVEELAQLLRCHPKTILRRIWARKLVASRPDGQGYWLIPESEAKRYLNDGVNA